MVSGKVEDMVKSEVKRTFNPEFLNRLDEVIIFNALTRAGPDPDRGADGEPAEPEPGAARRSRSR